MAFVRPLPPPPPAPCTWCVCVEQASNARCANVGQASKERPKGPRTRLPLTRKRKNGKEREGTKGRCLPRLWFVFVNVFFFFRFVQASRRPSRLFVFVPSLSAFPPIYTTPARPLSSTILQAPNVNHTETNTCIHVTPDATKNNASAPYAHPSQPHHTTGPPLLSLYLSVGTVAPPRPNRPYPHHNHYTSSPPPPPSPPLSLERGHGGGAPRGLGAELPVGGDRLGLRVELHALFWGVGLGCCWGGCW